MFKFLKFIRNQIILNERLTAEERQQESEGYKIKFMHEGNESHIIYYEGNKRIPIGFKFNLLNDVTLDANSYRQWQSPKIKELTSSEYEKVQNRLVKYFSCWGGDVRIDNLPLKLK